MCRTLRCLFPVKRGLHSLRTGEDGRVIRAIPAHTWYTNSLEIPHIRASELDRLGLCCTESRSRRDVNFPLVRGFGPVLAVKGSLRRNTLDCSVQKPLFRERKRKEPSGREQSRSLPMSRLERSRPAADASREVNGAGCLSVEISCRVIGGPYDPTSQNDARRTRAS